MSLHYQFIPSPNPSLNPLALAGTLALALVLVDMNLCVIQEIFHCHVIFIAI